MKESSKVVCVPFTPPQPERAYAGAFHVIGGIPMVGSVYTVAKVFPPHLITKSVGVALVGSTTVCVKTGVEVGWDSRNFRDLYEMKREAALRKSEPAKVVKVRKPRKKKAHK
jgi:hypothetical protein